MQFVRLGSVALAVLLLVSVSESSARPDLTEAERKAALERAHTANERAMALFRQGKYAEALPLARKSLELCERVHGPDHPAVADALNALGLIRKVQGAYVEARASYERALAVREEAYGREHPAVAQSLTNLAALLRTKGLYEEARPLYERALEIHEGAYGRAHPAVASSLNGLALLHQDQGAYETARRLYERSLDIRTTSFGPRHPSVATCLNNLGELNRLLGAYGRARRLQEQAIEVYEQAYGREHPMVARSLNNLALVRLAQGSNEEAKPLLERTLAIYERAYGPSHPLVAVTLTNLAEVLMSQGAGDEARARLERALAMVEKALGPDHPKVAVTLSSLARLLHAEGAVPQARELLSRGQKIFEATYGANHPAVATNVSNLALLLRSEGKHAEACKLAERALEINERAYGPDHPEVARTLHRLAASYHSAGNLDRALRALARCLDVTERGVRRSFGALQPSERSRLLASVRHRLDAWLSLASTAERVAYPEVLRFKGIVTRATAAERRLARRGGDDAHARVEELRKAQRQLARLANSMPPMFKRTQHAAWQEAYARAGVEREELARALASDFAPLRECLEHLDLKQEDVRSAIGDHAALVDFLRSGERYVAWVLQPDEPTLRVDLGEAGAVEQAAAAFARASADPDVGLGDEGWRDAAQRLHDLVWAPIESHLRDGVETLHLCPDAALATVPFAALPAAAEGRLLIDDFLLVQLSMAQDLVPREGASTATRGTLALGGVDYRSATEAPQPAPQPAAPERASRGRDFGPLPETRAEVEALKQRLGDACTLLLGGDATESRLRAASAGRRILHLATHGFVRGDATRGLRRRRSAQSVWLGAAMERQFAAGHDPMNLAGLALAGANARQGGDADDGILTALEASQLNLDDAELVVLSACETALGRAESGEGVIGLVQGFQMAGARRVIASLWQVDDEATRLLMQHVYDGMLRDEDPLSPAEALREAALKVRGATGSGGRSFAAPRFWAGFVAYGR